MPGTTPAAVVVFATVALILAGCAASGILADQSTVPIPGMKAFVITSEPPGARVFLNREEIGETPRRLQWMPLYGAEERTVLDLRKEDHSPASVEFNFKATDLVRSASPGVTVRQISGAFSDTINVHARLVLLDTRAYERARRDNTREAYEEFIRAYPASVLVPEARAWVAELEFQRAVEQNTAEAYQTFLRDVVLTDISPRLREDARRRLEELSFVTARNADTLVAYRRFVQEFPGSAYAAVAQDRIRQVLAEADRRMVAGARLFLQGRLTEAAREYDEAIRLNPEHAEAHFHLATIFEREQHLDVAYRSALEAVRLAPENEDYRRLAERLRVQQR